MSDWKEKEKYKTLHIIETPQNEIIIIISENRKYLSLYKIQDIS